MKYLLFPFLFVMFGSQAQNLNKKETKAKFKVIVLSEDKGHHEDYSRAAKVWLNDLQRATRS